MTLPEIMLVSGISTPLLLGVTAIIIRTIESFKNENE